MSDTQLEKGILQPRNHTATQRLQEELDTLQSLARVSSQFPHYIRKSSLGYQLSAPVLEFGYRAFGILSTPYGFLYPIVPGGQLQNQYEFLVRKDLSERAESLFQTFNEAGFTTGNIHVKELPYLDSWDIAEVTPDYELFRLEEQYWAEINASEDTMVLRTPSAHSFETLLQQKLHQFPAFRV